MKRTTAAVIGSVIVLIVALIAALIYGIVQRDHQIADLTERNAALSRLCGPVVTTPPEPFATWAAYRDAIQNAPEVFSRPERRQFADEVSYRAAVWKFEARGNWATEPGERQP